MIIWSFMALQLKNQRVSEGTNGIKKIAGNVVRIVKEPKRQLPATYQVDSC